MRVLAVVECPQPPIVGNSTRIGDGRHYGAVIAYTCPHGYYINGTGDTSFIDHTCDSSATVHCQADGSWSHEPAACLSEYHKPHRLTCMYNTEPS